MGIYSESLHVLPRARETSPFECLRSTAVFRTGLAGKAERFIRRDLNIQSTKAVPNR